MLPFCCLTLTAPFPPDPAYPTELTTIGEHLKKCRLDLGLSQREAAAQIGVNYKALANWEGGSREPLIRYWPAFLKFLGYYPDTEPRTLAERVLAARRIRGLTCEELGRVVGTDSRTVWSWETKGYQPRARLAHSLGTFLAEVGV